MFSGGRARAASPEQRINALADVMRSGSDGRPRRPYNGNRPFQQQQPRPPQRNQTFDNNGPSVKIRGNAGQIVERYIALAREAAVGGDPVAAENFYQHAEHYLRIANANRDNAPPGALQSLPPAQTRTGIAEHDQTEGDEDRSQPGWGDDRPASFERHRSPQRRACHRPATAPREKTLACGDRNATDAYHNAGHLRRTP